ncbi:uncharacterized protein [Choristoneura fumiferana]|uniref:uncharacterized protein n=1 Tax=Choristoneura fumiferana TaxID=7141 RepID=UPI003D15CFE8
MEDDTSRGEGSSVRLTKGSGSMERGAHVSSRGEGLTHGGDQGASEVEDAGRHERIRRMSSRTEQSVLLDKMGKDVTARRGRSRRRRSSSSDDSDENERRRRKRPRTRRRRRRESSSSGSDAGSPRIPCKVKRGKDDNGSDTKVLLDKFLNILDKIKSSDKPKLTFNTNVIPEFDPMVKEQTILTWLTKVEECAQIYGWEDREIIHYSLPKLSGIAKTWYQGLSSLLFTWTEWKQKLIESFPLCEDYAELLHSMLAKTVKYGESLEHYYYAKINLLNRCKIYGKEAVDCLLYGVEDRAVKVGAQAAQFKQPEQVLKYFRTVKVGKVRDPGNEINPKKTNQRGTDKAGPSNSGIRCFNCNEVGHPSFKCLKPLVKCTTCGRIGHLAVNCFKNKAAPNKDDNQVSEKNNVPKQVSNRLGAT